jgi:hypothetical protein
MASGAGASTRDVVLRGSLNDAAVLVVRLELGGVIELFQRAITW